MIASTTTAAGLLVTCRLDRRKYAVGRKISDEEMKRVKIVKDKSHGEWNYTILPTSSDQTWSAYFVSLLRLRIDDMSGTGWVEYGAAGSGIGNLQTPSGLFLR